MNISFEKIDKIRANKGISPRKLMDELGFSSGLYYQWAKKSCRITEKSAKRIADYFGCTVEDFEEPSEIAPLPQNIHLIPVFESVSAGFGVYADDRIVGFLPVNVKQTDVDNTIAAKVVGNSMYPQICDGDTIIIRKNVDVESGDVAVILIDGDEAVVKKVKFSRDKLTLISFNPEYEDRVFNAQECEERVRIMGKVIGSYKSW